MRFLGWFAVIVLASCARPENAENHVGQPVSVLEEVEGAPTAIEPLPKAAQTATKASSKKAREQSFNLQTAKIYRYSNGRSFQVEDERVVAFHRLPGADEKTIQAWYQKPGAARRESSIARVDESKAGHVVLASVHFVDLGKTVVYDRGSGEVLKVIER